MDRHDDDNADLPETAILMTSSSRRVRNRKLEKRNRQNQQNEDRRVNEAAVRPAVRRRCSCGCDPTPSPTGNSLSHVDHVVNRPEVEISNGTMTSQWDGRSENPPVCIGCARVSRSGRVKPAINMTRNQVLRVYVLDDRQTGSDVMSHVTSRAPANRRALSAAPSEFSRRSIGTDLPAEWHQTMTSNLSQRDRFQRTISDGVPVFYTQTYQHDRANRNVEQTQPQTRTLGAFHRPISTVYSPPRHHKASTSLSVPNQPYRPVLSTESLDRRSVESSSSTTFRKSSPSKKRTIYSSNERNTRLRPGGVYTASLDRQRLDGFTQNFGHNSDDEDEWTNSSFTMQENHGMPFSVREDELAASKPTAVIGTSASSARSRTARRQNGDQMTSSFGAVVDRRRASTTGTGRALVDCDPRTSYQRRAMSLERPGDPINYRSRGLSTEDEDWTHSRWSNKRPTKDRSPNPTDEVDWINSRWIKRQIHLPTTRQRRLMSSADMSETPRRPSDADIRHTVHSQCNLISSRTDPDNVCFSQRTNDVCVLPVRTGSEVVYRTHADPSVRVQFTRDDNGNLVKVPYSFC